jgi:hypothetical protein
MLSWFATTTSGSEIIKYCDLPLINLQKLKDVTSLSENSKFKDIFTYIIEAPDGESFLTVHITDDHFDINQFSTQEFQDLKTKILKGEEIEVVTHSGFFATGILFRYGEKTKGTLALGLHTIHRDTTGERSEFIRGSNVLDFFLQVHFVDQVDAIQGEWGGGDNLNMFNQFFEEEYNKINNPVDRLNLSGTHVKNAIRVAAAKTWTGQQAAKHGFTEVTIEDVSWDEDLTPDSGVPVMKQLVVLFKKEKIKK